MSESSTKPYLLRAIYEWCTDNGYTPFLAARVNRAVKVPLQFVKDGEIVLNISFDATSGLKIDNDIVQFVARFGGLARQVIVPVGNVLAVYARENGQGMAFDVIIDENGDPVDSTDETTTDMADVAAPSSPSSVRPTLVDVNAISTAETENVEPNDNPPPKKSGKPTLTIIK